MASPEHLTILKHGVVTWNEWRREHPDVRPDLAEADLHMAELGRINLEGANLRCAKLDGARLNAAYLREANLMGANMSKAQLRGAQLKGANLRGADLHMAELSRAELIEANLTSASLNGANFREANIRGAEFGQARVGWTIFANNDLSKAMGLEAVKHDGPSHIGIDTIYKSGGSIPENFLRGAGVPAGFITYMHSFVDREMEFYSCFISYSTADQEFASRLYEDLRGEGVRCWFAPHDMAAGKKIHEQIGEAILTYDKLLLILSTGSMASSWVQTEIGKARRRETMERKRVLFPVGLIDYRALLAWECFDTDNGKDSAREIREYFIPDFSDWKNDDLYQLAFKRLLRDLKAQALKLP